MKFPLEIDGFVFTACTIPFSDVIEPTKFEFNQLVSSLRKNKWSKIELITTWNSIECLCSTTPCLCQTEI